MLRLRGPLGSLDIVVSYFHTGSDLTEHDLHGLEPHLRSSATSFPALQALLRSRIADSLADSQDVLTIFGGDFNYVTSSDDR
eukprot:6664418-Pyramimonas_sp.AAC.1